jgi:hypothetical protein
MVPSSVITITIDGERLMCGGFFLSETVHLGNFEFITDYFRMENALTAQATMTVPLRTTAPRLKTGLPFERCHVHHEGQQAQACAR